MRRGIERLDPFGGPAEPSWCGPERSTVGPTWPFDHHAGELDDAVLSRLAEHLRMEPDAVRELFIQAVGPRPDRPRRPA